MALWVPQYEVDRSQGGDTIYSAFGKTNSEHQAIYNRLNELRTSRAGATPPPDPEQYELWLDTSTTPATLKMYDGTTWVDINVGSVDGYDVGNASGNIPLNNGTLNTNLNADKLDGYDAGNGSGQIPVSNGTLNTNLNADMVDGYHVGTATNQIPLSQNVVHDPVQAGLVAGDDIFEITVNTFPDENFTLLAGTNIIYNIGKVYVKIPAGKKLYLGRSRYYIDGNMPNVTGVDGYLYIGSYYVIFSQFPVADDRNLNVLEKDNSNGNNFTIHIIRIYLRFFNNTIYNYNFRIDSGSTIYLQCYII